MMVFGYPTGVITRQIWSYEGLETELELQTDRPGTLWVFGTSINDMTSPDLVRQRGRFVILIIPFGGVEEWLDPDLEFRYESENPTRDMVPLADVPAIVEEPGTEQEEALCRSAGQILPGDRLMALRTIEGRLLMPISSTDDFLLRFAVGARVICMGSRLDLVALLPE